MDSVAPPLTKVSAFRGDDTLGAGKPHLLFFWATWCVPCKFSVPEVMAFAKAKGIEVIAITDEDPDQLTQFFKERTEPFPATVAIDPYRMAFQSYGVSGTPTFVLVDADGKVKSYHRRPRHRGLELQRRRDTEEVVARASRPARVGRADPERATRPAAQSRETAHHGM